MHLFTKEIDNKLFKQYPMGADLDNQVVVAKIFNPYGRGVWYLLNSDPEDPDYIWAISNIFDVETGSVSRKELEELRVPPFNLGLERDLYFAPISAKSLYEGLRKGETFADGGTLATTEVITDKNGDAWLFPNNPDNKDFGIKLADGGEVDEDYHSAFRKYIEYKFRGKNYNGWKFYFDNLTGTFYWIKDNVEVMATPFYDGYDAIPIDIIKTENGDPLYQDMLEFTPTNVLEVDEKRYFALLSPYLMVVEGQEFKKGGKMPVIRTQFEEEEFEYADGGRTKGMNNATGESYGVVIGSIKKADDDLEGATKMNVRTSYQSRISEEELIFDKNGNLYQITDFGYALEGNYPSTSRGSAHTYNADKKETLQVLSKKYNPSFAKKLIELAKDKKYADGGQTDWAAMRKEIDDRNMTIRFKIASVIGIDKALDYINRDYVISPFRLIEAAVSKGFITIDEIDEKLWDAATYEADDIDSSYRDSGEGIGSSDMNAFVSYMLNDAGIKVGVVDGRYTRMADGGYTSSFSGTPTRRSRLTMAKGGEITYSLKNGIRKYYMDTFPTDDMGKDINPKATFKGLNQALEDRVDNIYDYIGVGDSIVRERLFSKLADIMGVSYDVIYDKWEKGGVMPNKMAKGGMTKKSTFKDKVKAISARLEGTKVKSKYKGKYGATYDKKEAKEAASKIVGKLRAKYGK
jgi:hypothetical protein